MAPSIINGIQLAAMVITIYMLVFFIMSVVLKNMSIVDIGWGSGFVLIAWVLIFMQDDPGPTQLILAVVTTIWGLRLSGVLFLRNYGQSEDFRYRNWRAEWGKWAVARSFFQVFLLQGVVMLLNSLPIIIVMSAQMHVDVLHPAVLAGLILWMVGFFFESVGDWQKYQFRKEAANKNKFIQSGLWRYTRHPNYFGEILLWWGVFLIAVPFGNWYLSIVGPLVITFLLVKVSGVPMLEKKYDSNAAYQEYKRQTNALIPGFRKKSKN